MTSWYSSLLTTTTSRISNLRSTLLASEADGDTEDDTHVCRVLRNYYTEKGRAFPAWLPPDPKAPPPAAPVYTQPPVGSRYGGLSSQPQSGPASGLSSLWDNSNNATARQDPVSLRQARGAPPPLRGADPSRNPFANRGSAASDPRDDVQARPLPSQRAGSYQTASGAFGRDSAGSTPPGSSSGGGSAQDRLKQRLWGGARTASPAAPAAFQPPPQSQQQQNKGASRYGGGYGGGGGSRGGADSYEDRFAPGGMYDASGGSGGSDKPFVAANAPWATNEYEFSGGAGATRAGGLPSGPRRGLPSGPRMR